MPFFSEKFLKAIWMPNMGAYLYTRKKIMPGMIIRYSGQYMRSALTARWPKGFALYVGCAGDCNVFPSCLTAEKRFRDRV